VSDSFSCTGYRKRVTDDITAQTSKARRDYHTKLRATSPYILTLQSNLISKLCHFTLPSTCYRPHQMALFRCESLLSCILGLAMCLYNYYLLAIDAPSKTLFAIRRQQQTQCEAPRRRHCNIKWTANTGLFISPSWISGLCSTITKTDTAERSISTDRETLQVCVLLYRCSIYPPLVMRQTSIL
jgi:hypothetical protein